DVSRHFVDRSMMLCETDAVKHKPSGLLCHMQSACNLVRTDAVLAIANHPHRTQPFVERNSGILENGADLDRELLTAVEAGPHQPRLEKRQPFGLAARAFWAIGPLGFGNSFQAHYWVRKI